MTQQTINIGTTADDGTGDPARTAFGKVNDNFDEQYAALVPSANAVEGHTLSLPKTTSVDAKYSLVVPWAIDTGYSDFVGQTYADAVIAIGYNVSATSNRLDSSEPSNGVWFESDYYTSGARYAESYFQFVPVTGDANRPIFFQWDRTTGALITSQVTAAGVNGATGFKVLTQGVGESGNVLWEFKRNDLIGYCDNTAADSTLSLLGAGTARKGRIILGYAATNTAVQIYPLGSANRAVIAINSTESINFYRSPNGGNAGGALAVGAVDDNTACIGAYNTANSNTVKGLVVRAHATQNANVLEAQTSASAGKFVVDKDWNVVVSDAALATNATNGFLYLPTSAGVPTGTPTTYTGRVPVEVDTTNARISAYVGGAWQHSQLSAGVIGSTVTTKQNDYAPTGWATCSVLRWNGAGSTGITGFDATGLLDGVTRTIVNASSDYVLWLECANAASAAANRIALPKGLPAFLLPGDSITLIYDLTSTVWRVRDWPNQGQGMGFVDWADMAHYTTGNQAGALSGYVSGSGASIVNGADGALPGTTRVATGTTTTGQASLGGYQASIYKASSAGGLVGACLFVGNATDGTETYQTSVGFGWGDAATHTYAVCWEYRWNGSAAELAQTYVDNTSYTRSTTGSPAITGIATATTPYTLLVYLSPAWNNADFIYSTDGTNYVLASRIAVSLVSGAPRMGAMCGIAKAAGTTTRYTYVDWMGVRLMTSGNRK